VRRKEHSYSGSDPKNLGTLYSIHEATAIAFENYEVTRLLRLCAEMHQMRVDQRHRRRTKCISGSGEESGAGTIGAGSFLHHEASMGEGSE